MPDSKRETIPNTPRAKVMRRQPDLRDELTVSEAGPLFAHTLNLLNSLIEKPDTDSLFEAISQSLRKIMGADELFFVEIMDELRIVRYSGRTSNDLWHNREISHEHSFAGEVIKADRLIWTSDISQEDYYTEGLHDLEPMQTFCGIPIHVNGATFGVLEVIWAGPHHVTGVERTLLAVVADRIADSLTAIEAVKAERRHEELRAGLSELAALAMKPANSQAESTENSKLFFERLEEVLRARAVLFVADRKKDPKGSPLHLYYVSDDVLEDVDPCGNSSDLPQEAPYRMFRKFADSKDSILFESLEDNEEIQRWVKRHFGISHGMIMSNRRVLDSTGCMICGRSDREPSLSADEKAVLQSAANDMTLGSIDRLLKLEETNISHTLQKSLANMVSTGPEFSVEDFYLSATSGSHVGGDFYQVFETRENQLVVLLGDVSGKGANLASLGFLAKNVVFSYLERDTKHTPAEAIAELNKILYYARDIKRFVSLILMVIDEETGKGTYCCAGHPPALLYRMATGKCEPISVTSPIVGALNDVEFKDRDIMFEREDTMLLYTDGTTEARAPWGELTAEAGRSLETCETDCCYEHGESCEREFFGEARTQQAFCAEILDGFEGITTRMFKRIKEFTGGQLNDDMALLALRYNGSSTQESPKTVETE